MGARSPASAKLSKDPEALSACVIGASVSVCVYMQKCPGSLIKLVHGGGC